MIIYPKTLAKFSIGQLSIALAMVMPISAIANSNTPTLTTPTGVNLLTNPITRLTTPAIGISDVSYTPTVLIHQTTKLDNQKLDVTLFDEFVDDISPNARHYPPNFPNRTAEYQSKRIVEQLANWIAPFAAAPNASFDVLLRSAKINSIGRNLDLGSEFGVRASQAITKALKLDPKHAEANFLYGMMLTEGGGFQEGEKYLMIAANQGYIEAEQSLAQSDLLNDQRSKALARLKKLQAAHPNHPQLAKQIELVNQGEFYIWAIKDNNLTIKPSKYQTHK